MNKPKLNKAQTNMLREILRVGEATCNRDSYRVGKKRFGAETGEGLYFEGMVDVKPGERGRRVVSDKGRAYLASLTA